MRPSMERDEPDEPEVAIVETPRDVGFHTGELRPMREQEGPSQCPGGLVICLDVRGQRKPASLDPPHELRSMGVANISGYERIERHSAAFLIASLPGHCAGSQPGDVPAMAFLREGQHLVERGELHWQAARTASGISRRSLPRWLWGAMLWFLLTPAAAAASPARPSPALLEQAATSDEGLRSLLDAGTGLVLIEYYQGCDVQQARHLCGEELEHALPDIRSKLARDRKVWSVDPALKCEHDRCFYDPGEVADYRGDYYFRRLPRGRLTLRAIVHRESGALWATKQERFAARAMHKWRNARCPR